MVLSYGRSTGNFSQIQNRYPMAGEQFPGEYGQFGQVSTGYGPGNRSFGRGPFWGEFRPWDNMGNVITGNSFDQLNKRIRDYLDSLNPTQPTTPVAGGDTAVPVAGGDTVVPTTGGDTVAGGVGDDIVTGGDTVVPTTGGDTGGDTLLPTTGGGVGGDTGLTTTAGATSPMSYQNLLGGWGFGQQGYGYNPGFNLPEAQYPVEGDRPTFSDYTNQQIIKSLRAEKNWAIPGSTEGTYREREGWDAMSDQDVLDYMASKSASWLKGQQEDYRPAALAQMGEDLGQRNEFQQRTQAADILNMANQGFLGSMGMMQNYGQGAMQEVWKNYQRNIGRGRAGLAGRGMTGTTVYDAMKRGAGEQSMQDWLTAQDAITGRKVQTYQQGIGGIVNALNSIQYRTMHPMEFANLYQAFGEGGAGAAVPEAPSTTTNALLGTALGVATPLLLNSIFGPIGAVAGGVLGSAAATGGNVLGGVGDLLSGAWDFVEDLWPF